jgi:hypothetical protein
LIPVFASFGPYISMYGKKSSINSLELFMILPFLTYVLLIFNYNNVINVIIVIYVIIVIN